MSGAVPMLQLSDAQKSNPKLCCTVPACTTMSWCATAPALKPGCTGSSTTPECMANVSAICASRIRDTGGKSLNAENVDCNNQYAGISSSAIRNITVSSTIRNTTKSSINSVKKIINNITIKKSFKFTYSGNTNVNCTINFTVKKGVTGSKVDIGCGKIVRNTKFNINLGGTNVSVFNSQKTTQTLAASSVQKVDAKMASYIKLMTNMSAALQADFKSQMSQHLFAPKFGSIADSNISTQGAVLGSILGVAFIAGATYCVKFITKMKTETAGLSSLDVDTPSGDVSEWIY